MCTPLNGQLILSCVAGPAKHFAERKIILQYGICKIIWIAEAVMTTNFIGARIKALREERKLSQDDLARLFGFKDRQTVSAIETGERRVTAEELVIAVEKLGASLDYFTDPFLLVGEGRFSWRQTDVGPQRLERL